MDLGTHQDDVDEKDKVFLCKDPAGKFYVVRPYDLRQAEIPYSDPVLNVVHYVGNHGSRNVVVVDSKSKAPGTKAIYVHRLLKQCTMTASGTTLERCKKLLCFELCVFFCMLQTKHDLLFTLFLLMPNTSY